MKIYDKLCELKDCSTLTGRVMEQRIHYNGTRYPEINKKVLSLLILILKHLRRGTDFTMVFIVLFVVGFLSFKSIGPVKGHPCVFAVN